MTTIEPNLLRVKDINYTEYALDNNTINLYVMDFYFKYKYDNITNTDYIIKIDIVDTLPTKENYVITILKTENRELLDITTINNHINSIMSQSSQYRFIFMPLYITATINNVAVGHANTLIYDIVTNELELFEPHGKLDLLPTTNYNEMLQAIRQLLSSNGYIIKEFYTPITFCPRESFQYVQYGESKKYPNFDSGFCLIWSLWYIDLRFSNSSVSRSEIVDYAMKHIGHQNFTNFIGNYSSFVSYIKNNVLKCSTNVYCKLDNFYFTIMLQFYDLIDLNVLVFNENNKKIGNILETIIKHCGKSQLNLLCESYHPVINVCHTNSAEKLRNAVIRFIDEDNLEICKNIYMKLVNETYIPEFNAFIFCRKVVSPNRVAVLNSIVPYDDFIFKLIMQTANLFYDTTDSVAKTLNENDRRVYNIVLIKRIYNINRLVGFIESCINTNGVDSFIQKNIYIDIDKHYIYLLMSIYDEIRSTHQYFYYWNIVDLHDNYFSIYNNIYNKFCTFNIEQKIHILHHLYNLFINYIKK